MLLASAVIAVVLAAVLLALTVRAFFAADRSLMHAERALRRQHAWATERGHFLSNRARIADGVQTGTEAVAFGSAVTRAGHKAIAAIPFGLMRAIPATRERGRRLQAAHDEKAEQIYGSIENMSSRIADGVRRRLVGEGLPVGRELTEAEATQILRIEWDEDED
jgi:hypothetical protein